MRKEETGIGDSGPSLWLGLSHSMEAVSQEEYLLERGYSKRTRQSCMSFYDPVSEVTKHHFATLYWLNHPQAYSDSRKEDIDSPSRREEC